MGSVPNSAPEIGSKTPLMGSGCPFHQLEAGRGPRLSPEPRAGPFLRQEGSEFVCLMCGIGLKASLLVSIALLCNLA